MVLQYSRVRRPGGEFAVGSRIRERGHPRQAGPLREDIDHRGYEAWVWRCRLGITHEFRRIISTGAVMAALMGVARIARLRDARSRSSERPRSANVMQYPKKRWCGASHHIERRLHASQLCQAKPQKSAHSRIGIIREHRLDRAFAHDRGRIASRAHRLCFGRAQLKSPVKTSCGPRGRRLARRGSRRAE